MLDEISRARAPPVPSGPAKRHPAIPIAPRPSPESRSTLHWRSSRGGRARSSKKSPPPAPKTAGPPAPPPHTPSHARPAPTRDTPSENAADRSTRHTRHNLSCRPRRNHSGADTGSVRAPRASGIWFFANSNRSMRSACAPSRRGVTADRPFQMPPTDRPSGNSPAVFNGSWRPTPAFPAETCPGANRLARAKSTKPPRPASRWPPRE